VNRFGYQPFDLLGRYETALWKQTAQIMQSRNEKTIAG
jgi:hypothetical protein